MSNRKAFKDVRPGTLWVALLPASIFLILAALFVITEIHNDRKQTFLNLYETKVSDFASGAGYYLLVADLDRLKPMIERIKADKHVLKLNLLRHEERIISWERDSQFDALDFMNFNADVFIYEAPPSFDEWQEPEVEEVTEPEKIGQIEIGVSLDELNQSLKTALIRLIAMFGFTAVYVCLVLRVGSNKKSANE